MRLQAKAWLERLDDARTLALAGDAEGVHQVRVAARRLRVWLGFKGHAALEEALRWACGELALLRDLEIFGEALMAEPLAELKARATQQAVEALESPRWSALRQALEQTRAPKKSRARRASSKLERRLEKRRATLPAGEGDALHALRRSIRRVRYAQEWLGIDASALAAEQERLGALCDLLALRAFAKSQRVEVPAQLSEAITRAFELLEGR
ncbi:MAG: CHAD domain-containing protein [Archangium sp.]|nr:CHAD domain-containing protein [Archangium sp.]MDP3152152.1 CHAD domain-containing protein [Archangium sp.]MDP3574966.1 CHAD domain-containing protein [Archangium sp.]